MDGEMEAHGQWVQSLFGVMKKFEIVLMVVQLCEYTLALYASKG